MSGTSLRGIIRTGGERAPLLFGEGGYAPPGLPRPQTPPPFRAALAGVSSVETLYELFEDVAAVFKIVEHVEARARRREEHDVAGRRERARALDGRLHGIAVRQRDRRGGERGADLLRVLPDQHGVDDPPARRVGERLPRLALALAAR